jgi:hypothetical protein
VCCHDRNAKTSADGERSVVRQTHGTPRFERHILRSRTEATLEVGLVSPHALTNAARIYAFTHGHDGAGTVAMRYEVTTGKGRWL